MRKGKALTARVMWQLTSAQVFSFTFELRVITGVEWGDVYHLEGKLQKHRYKREKLEMW